MLDTTTLLAMTSIVTIFVAFLFIVIWRGHTRYAGMNIIKIGSCLFAASSMLSALRNILPDIATACIGVANLGSMIGSSMIMNGALILAEKRPLWRWHFTIIALLSIPFSYYLFVHPATPARAGLSAFCGLFIGTSTLLAFLCGQKTAVEPATRNSFVALLILECAAELARGILVPLIDPHIDYRKPSPVLTFFYLEVIFFLIGYLVLMLQFVNDRLRGDLRRSEERITAAFQVTDDAFALFDRQGHLVVKNACFDTFFPEAVGWIREGITITELFGPKPELFGLELEWLVAYLGKASAPAELDRVAYLPRGIWLHVSGRTSRDGGLVLCWRDITSFKQAEDILSTELARERELAALQRNFVSMASHQFRTPLAVIDINAQLLEARGTIPLEKREVHDRVARIRRTVGRMVGLIETMLGAASIEAGKMRLKREPVDIGDLLHEISERAREFAPTRQFDIDIGAMPAKMLCDPTLIDQVFSNLLANAVKYSKPPSLVRLMARTNGGEVVVAVTDFGIGIAEEDQEMIFERFFRASNVRDVVGTGIGLTVARSIVELHGGRLSVESKIGVGSTFTVHLPIA